MSFFMGIDPGKSGAIAVLTGTSVPIKFVKLCETEFDIAEFIGSYAEVVDHACIEKVGATPQMGVVSAFTFGRSFGFCLGVLSALRVPYTRIAPVTWQKTLDCRSKGDKNITKSRAQELWPTFKFTHANADAFLLAEFARRLHVGNQPKKARSKV